MSANACHPCQRPARAGRSHDHGFTLIELIMVIVLLGVLAVFAAPRLMQRSDTNAQGFHDTTLSYLRYAQKTAIAQRRTVCVAFASTSASLRIANNAGVFDCSGSSGIVLNGPDGKLSASVSDANYAVATINGIACLATPAAFSFDGLGQPVNSSGAAIATAQCMQVANAANSITVEAATGYIHE